MLGSRFAGSHTAVGRGCTPLFRIELLSKEYAVHANGQMGEPANSEKSASLLHFYSTANGQKMRGPRIQASAGPLLRFLLPRPAIFSLQWLHDKPISYGSGRNLDSLGLAINDCSHRLEVRLDLALADSGDIQANATLILWAASVMDLPSRRCSGTCEMTNASHGLFSSRNRGL